MKTIRFYYSKPRCRVYFEGYIEPHSGKRQTNTKVVPLPRICICGLYDKDTDILAFGVARCSKADQFIKKEARTLAENRAKTSPFFSVKVGNSVRVYDVFIDYSRKIEKEVLSSQPTNIVRSKCLYS